MHHLSHCVCTRKSNIDSNGIVCFFTSLFIYFRHVRVYFTFGAMQSLTQTIYIVNHHHRRKQESKTEIIDAYKWLTSRKQKAQRIERDSEMQIVNLLHDCKHRR